MPYRLFDPATNPRTRAFLHAVGGAATAILVLGAMFFTVYSFQLIDAIRSTQVDNTKINGATNRAAESAERGTKRIEDCTTPGRPCFDESQKRLAEVIVSINDYATYAAACADRPRQQTVEEIQTCIVAQIAEDKKARDR
jgi:hypothetical protein